MVFDLFGAILSRNTLQKSALVQTQTLLLPFLVGCSVPVIGSLKAAQRCPAEETPEQLA